MIDRNRKSRSVVSEALACPSDCGLHPLIHTSAPNESSTKYCSSVSKGKVWIKVCNPQFALFFFNKFLLK